MTHSIRLGLVSWLKSHVYKLAEHISQYLSGNHAHPVPGHDVHHGRVLRVDGYGRQGEINKPVHDAIFGNGVMEDYRDVFVPNVRNDIAQSYDPASLNNHLVGHHLLPSQLKNLDLDKLNAKSAGVESEKPAFIVINLASKERWAVFASGHIEGFPDGCVVINRIPLHVRSTEGVAL